jgi:hypothetical protein
VAFIPRGSLLFSGFGDSVMQFRSPTGIKLTAPSTMPVAGVGNLGIATLDDGTICFTGGIPPFSLLYGTFNSQLGNLQGDAFGVTLVSCVTNYSNRFYGAYSSAGPTPYKLYVINNAGAKIAEYSMGTNIAPNAMVVGVAPDESAAYFAPRSSTGGTVSRRDLSGGTTSTFATYSVGTLGVNGNQGILVLRNGDVLIAWSASGSASGVIKRYSSAGVELMSYPALTCGVLAAGLDDTTFWAGTYDGATTSGVRIYEFRTADAAIVNQFDPVDGSFEFDGPFTVIRANIGYPSTFVPAPVPNQPQAPCDPQASLSGAAKGLSGCNVGGVGWVSSYAGPYGSAPVYPDPADGETLTGKHNVDVWVQIVHTDEQDVQTTYRRSLIEIATHQNLRVEAGLLAVGDIEHGLGNEQGSFEAATVQISFTDTIDRLFRTLCDSEELEGDEITVLAETPEGRAASTEPRVLLRAILTKPQFGAPLQATITAVDALFWEYGPLATSRLWPPLMPKLVGFDTPADVLATPLSPLFGEKSDEGATDPKTGALTPKGLIPGRYLGDVNLSRYVLPLPTPPTSAITLDSAIPQTGTNYVVNSADERPTLYDPLVTLGDRAHPVFAWLVIMRGTVGNVAISAYGATVFDTTGWTPAGSTDAYGIYASWNPASDPLNQITEYRLYVSDASDFDPLGSPGSATKARYKTHDTTTIDSVYSWYAFTLNFLNWTEGTDALTGSVTASTPVLVSEPWGVVFFSAGTGRFFGVYGSDQAGGNTGMKPDRVKLDPNRADLLVPGLSGAWPYATTYQDYLGEDGTTYRMMVILVRGPLLDNHKNGVVSLAANMIGIDDVGDNTGHPVIDFEACRQMWLDNFVFDRYTSGLFVTNTPGSFPAFDNGVSKVKSTAFAAHQVFTASALGGRGLTAGWYPDTQKSLLDWINEWDASGETETGTDAQGRVTIAWLDETQDSSSWPLLEHSVDVFGTITHTRGEARETSKTGSCDYDPDTGRFRLGPATVSSAAGILRYKHRDKPGLVLESTILNDAQQLSWVLQRHVARKQFGTNLADVPGHIGFMDHDVGQGVLLTSIEGTGASGWVARPFLITRRRFTVGPRIVTHTLWDVSDVLYALRFPNGLSQLFRLDDESTSPATARPLGDETAVPPTALVLP